MRHKKEEWQPLYLTPTDCLLHTRKKDSPAHRKNKTKKEHNVTKEDAKKGQQKYQKHKKK